MKDLAERIKKSLSVPLLGERAHGVMMNYKRETAAEVRRGAKQVKESAVVILLYPKNGIPHFILLKRHDYEGVHSGQVGLPGGKIEEGDSDHLAAGLRELEEECGVRVNRDQVVAELSEIYIPPSNFIVRPFVAVCHDELEFSFDEREVKFGIEVDLNALLADDNVKSSSIFIPKYERHIRVKNFLFGGEVVWGATAMILMEFKLLTKEN